MIFSKAFINLYKHAFYQILNYIKALHAICLRPMLLNSNIELSSEIKKKILFLCFLGYFNQNNSISACTLGQFQSMALNYLDYLEHWLKVWSFSLFLSKIYTYTYTHS